MRNLVLHFLSDLFKGYFSVPHKQEHPHLNAGMLDEKLQSERTFSFSCVFYAMEKHRKIYRSLTGS